MGVIVVCRSMASNLFLQLHLEHLRSLTLNVLLIVDARGWGRKSEHPRVAVPREPSVRSGVMVRGARDPSGWIDREAPSPDGPGVRVLEVDSLEGRTFNEIALGLLHSAIEEDFEAVVYLPAAVHGSSDSIRYLVAPILDGSADATVGVMETMPRGMMFWHRWDLARTLAKRLGNLYGCPWRGGLLRAHAWSTRALRSLPLDNLTSSRVLFMDLLIQHVVRNVRVRTVAIPLPEGNPGDVLPLAYESRAGLSGTCAARLHKMGLAWQHRYDVIESSRLYEAKLGYRSSHTMAIEAVQGDTRVLDLMCGPGHIGRELADKRCKVVGIDREGASMPWMEGFIKHNLKLGLPELTGSFDYVLALDALEHLEEPERLLRALRERCRQARFVITVPNVGFFTIRMGLLAGRFHYGREGILDMTHRRLFTWRSLRRMLEDTGYEVQRIRGIPAPYPKALGRTFASDFLLGLNAFLIALWPRMFAYQIYVECVPRPLFRIQAGKRETVA